jgi:hypothetical protein
MKPRSPQLALRFDAELSASVARWRDGAELRYLGGRLVLLLDTDRKAAVRDGNTLHLPLPPAATPRQIQDSVEAWLRREAMRLIGASMERQSQRLARPVPPWALSFSARSDWVHSHADGSLRCNWRLIEQPVALIEQAVGQALAALPLASATTDFWEAA